MTETEGKRITVKLPLSLLKVLDTEAEKLHVTRTDIVRYALADYFRVNYREEDGATVEEAAKFLDISLRSVREYCASGELKATKVGRSWYIDQNALWEFRRKLEDKGKRRGPRPRFS